MCVDNTIYSLKLCNGDLFCKIQTFQSVVWWIYKIYICAINVVCFIGRVKILIVILKWWSTAKIWNLKVCFKQRPFVGEGALLGLLHQAFSILIRVKDRNLNFDVLL